MEPRTSFGLGFYQAADGNGNFVSMVLIACGGRCSYISLFLSKLYRACRSQGNRWKRGDIQREKAKLEVGRERRING